MPITLEPAERARRWILLVARILAPVSAPSLRGALALMARQGELEHAEVDGERYLWPTPRESASHGDTRHDVRLLAPFDPLVWDQRHFEHLWEWSYRFEAYTSPVRRNSATTRCRCCGAMRSLGGLTSRPHQDFSAEFGFAGPRPQGRAFNRALDAEITRLQRFLDPVFQARS